MSFGIVTFLVTNWEPKTRYFRQNKGHKTRKCEKSDILFHLLYILTFYKTKVTSSIYREVEVPARREQVDQAKLQDREYERYVRESLSRLRPSQRTLSASSLIIRESSGSGTNGERSETGSVSGLKFFIG